MTHSSLSEKTDLSTGVFFHLSIEFCSHKKLSSTILHGYLVYNVFNILHLNQDGVSRR